MSGDASPLKTPQKPHYFCHTHFVEHTGCLVWKISGFTTQCPCQQEECLKSPTFRITGDERDWCLKIYPKGERGAEGYISMFLHLNGKEKVFITCEMSFMDATGEKFNSNTFSVLHEVDYGYRKFISLIDLMERKDLLLPNDELTVCCTLTKKVEMTGKCVFGMKRSPDVSKRNTLNDCMAKFFHEKKNTDVVLKVGTDQISAHKIVLTSRSPVFASMFEHEMLEKSTNEVVIADVEIDVLRDLVRFMYTDEVSHRDVDFAISLLVAADKYDLQSLRTLCSEYLCANVSTSNVFEILAVANACNAEEIIECCMGVIECEMSSVTCLSEWISKLKDRPEMLGVIEYQLNRKKQSAGA